MTDALTRERDVVESHAVYLVPAQDPPLGRRRGNIERWTGESWLGSSHAGNPHMEVTECPSKWPFQFEYEFGVRLFRRGFVKAVLRPPAAERVPHHASTYAHREFVTTLPRPAAERVAPPNDTSTCGGGRGVLIGMVVLGLVLCLVLAVCRTR